MCEWMIGWPESPISADDGFDVVTPEIRTLRNFRRQIRKLEVIPDPYVLFWVSRLFLGAFLKKTATSVFFFSSGDLRVFFFQDSSYIYKERDRESEGEETHGLNTDDSACDAFQESPSDSSDIGQL